MAGLVQLLGEYAWSIDNADFQYQKVGKKKPNPWGLYDMHGNVFEWTLTGYDWKEHKRAYRGRQDGFKIEPVSQRLHFRGWGRVILGGAFPTPVDEMRLAGWTYPILWSPGLGFRVVFASG